MELSEYLQKLREELVSLTRFAGEDVARTAALLAEALESSVRLTMLDLLSAAAEEVTARLGDTVVEVRLADGEPTFVVMTAPPEAERDEPGPASAAEADEAGTARVTLRLPEGLKANIEAAAAREGVSVNTWLVRAASRALRPGGRGQQSSGRWMPGQRITGYARS
jgi:HicB family